MSTEPNSAGGSERFRSANALTETQAAEHLGLNHPGFVGEPLV